MRLVKLQHRMAYQQQIIIKIIIPRRRKIILNNNRSNNSSNLQIIPIRQQQIRRQLPKSLKSLLKIPTIHHPQRAIAPIIYSNRPRKIFPQNTATQQWQQQRPPIYHKKIPTTNNRQWRTAYIETTTLSCRVDRWLYRAISWLNKVIIQVP